MRRRLVATAAVALAAGLAACSQSDQIDRSGAVYEGIGAEETITLLGTEPFWRIDIAPQATGHRAVYAVPDNPDGEQFDVERFAGNNGAGFSGEMGGEAVQIAVTPGDCSDAMSDRIYPFNATIRIGETRLLGCGYTDAQGFEGEEMP